VRFLGRAVLFTAAAISAVAPSMVQAEEGHRVAVIDVAYIFKNHPSIKAEVDKVEADLKAYDQELTGKRDELKKSCGYGKQASS
jgi:Skp family chaperone for outer membrane proteins